MLLIGQLRAIRVLCAVADTGSFSSAARAVGMTQSAVSQHIATLEGVVGLPLVQRGTRPLELTEAGTALVRHGASVLAQLETAEQKVGEIGGRLAARLRLGSFPTALVSFVAQALVRLRHHRPDLALSVIDDHQQGLLPRLANGELDVAVVYQHPVVPGEGPDRLARVDLFDDPFRVLLPTGHPRAADPEVMPLSALDHEVWIGGRTGSAWYRIVRHACLAAGFEPRTVLSTDDYRALQAFVGAGLGVAVVPGLAAERPLPGVVVRDLVSAPVRRVSVARPMGDPVLPQVQLMIDLLVEVTAGRRSPAAAAPAAPPRA